MEAEPQHGQAADEAGCTRGSSFWHPLEFHLLAANGLKSFWPMQPIAVESFSCPRPYRGANSGRCLFTC